MLIIQCYGADDDTRFNLEQTKKRLGSCGHVVKLQFYKRPYRRGKREVKGVTELEYPIIDYCVGTERRVHLTGSFSAVSYLWQALRALREGDKPSAVKRRKKRGYEEIEEIGKYNAAQKRSE